jgi:hypothetical protein
MRTKQGGHDQTILPPIWVEEGKIHQQSFRGEASMRPCSHGSWKLIYMNFENKNNLLNGELKKKICDAGLDFRTY